MDLNNTPHLENTIRYFFATKQDFTDRWKRKFKDQLKTEWQLDQKKLMSLRALKKNVNIDHKRWEKFVIKFFLALNPTPLKIEEISEKIKGHQFLPAEEQQIKEIISLITSRNQITT